MTLCINPSCSKPQNPDRKLFCLSCGSELLLAGKYRAIALLSEKEGFGRIYQAIANNNTNKVLQVLTLAHPKDVELFKRSAQVLNQLHHPGIPKGGAYFIYYAKRRKTPLHCQVIEHIEGINLEQYQQQQHYAPIPQNLALEWLIQLVEILHEVHSHNFFHGNINPANIILKPDGRLGLINFAAVWQFTAKITQKKDIYTPLEQAKGYAVRQSDFFALGRTFVYLLTGNIPPPTKIYRPETRAVSWRDRVPELHPQFANLLDEMMAKKPYQRPYNTGLILQELGKIALGFSEQEKSSRTQGDRDLFKTDFWRRLLAYIIDLVFIGTLASVMGVFIGCQLSAAFDLDFRQTLPLFTIVNFSILWGIFFDIWGVIAVAIASFFLLKLTWIEVGAYLVFIFLGVFLKCFYFTVLESSDLQATFGKMFLGIRVVDIQGKRILFGRANRRFWTKFLSTMMIHPSYFKAIFKRKKRPLHDVIAGTVIVKKQNTD